MDINRLAQLTSVRVCHPQFISVRLSVCLSVCWACSRQTDVFCQNPQLLHSSEHKTRLLVWWPALDSEITSPQHFNNYTGCQCNIASPSYFIYSCTEYTRNEHHHILLIKSLLQQICNPVLVCTPPVPANIRLQGHASNSEREASPTQDLLHGTVSHNTFEK